MKFNILYLLFPAALGACFWIVRDFKGQSAHSFFGIAETESEVLNTDQDVEVLALLVKVGDAVKKGDTLAVFDRADLNRSEAERLGDLSRFETERNAENAVLEKEKELVDARYRVKISELQAQMRLLHVEDSLKIVYRKNIYENLSLAESRLPSEKINALRKEIGDLETQMKEELRLLEARQKSNSEIARAKTAQSQSDLRYLRAERDKLLLLSPIDGYVESVYFNRYSLVPAHRDLMRINPRFPNKIIGFIYENAEIPFVLGQEVDLSSAARPQVKAKGKIIGSNPKMTELPLRLRKFIELRAWGREVFVQLPDTNRFFISEKILISLPAAVE